jgi:hypothetical protein
VTGFESEFEFQFGSNPYVIVWNGIRYATAQQAFANSQMATFTLATTEMVHFGLNDCPGCTGDNRGGNSLLVSAAPEPTSWILIATGLVGVLGYGRRRRDKAA